MPLWFEIAVLVLLASIAVALIDICFRLESVNRDFVNFAIRLETAIEGNPDTTLNDE